MRISTFFYTLKQGVINIFRNKLFSLASIATISACLFLFGLFYAVILNFQNVVRTAEEDVSVTVFFKDGTTQEEMEQIGAQIRARDEVSEAKFISADEAWAEWAPENIGEDYNEIYTENPLEGMDNYEIYMNDVSKQESLVSWLESIPQVDESTVFRGSGDDVDRRECARGIHFGRHYCNFAGSFRIPDQQHGYDRYFCSQVRD